MAPLYSFALIFLAGCLVALILAAAALLTPPNPPEGPDRERDADP